MNDQKGQFYQTIQREKKGLNEMAASAVSLTKH